ncbi:hypothetical protein TVAG_475870 [Trichomonas vaginalis G3]|uniref:Uncharacterized protein n=1 Tax=Trichomonas vaginalis (strain ATCC PRA-98 / G3) TaxID=412133 RepID=A2DA11_TRIV3|nr:hypothetical protein TVAGG3_0265850 [Trichomonas vaginalis G3]EAY22659.1 hypothetical protein TVAG_475870 [Trichomonas vaginalis G3]KAI5525473.1 hypothetical protein TVAGG3_0265850 [Trichomonas vaginalis G3]|eukprot:XP_001583645.1 hypothetical protein [Trichomonas vaginalis G3]
MEEFDRFFPLGIANKKSLVTSSFFMSFSSDEIKTIAWRFFLIIFPNTDKEILKKEEWIGILNSQREFYTQFINLQLAEPTKEIKDSFYESAAENLLFMNPKKTVNRNQMSEMKQMFNLLIHSNSNKDIIKNTGYTLSRIYYTYRNTCKANDDTLIGKLLDEKYLFQDIYASMKSLNLMLAPYLDPSNKYVRNSAYASLIQQLKEDCPTATSFPSESKMQDILEMYHKLFCVNPKHTENFNDLLTVIFSNFPDSSIFNLIYSNLFVSGDLNFTNTKIPGMIRPLGVNLHIIQMYTFEELIASLGIISKTIQNLIEENDSPELRKIAKYQLSLFSKVIQGEINMDEIVPLHVCLDQIQN